MARLAPCGIDCTACAIYKAARDPFAALRLAEQWRDEGLRDASPEWFQCEGCWGDRARCWTSDCKIRSCAVGIKGLESCSQCKDFPCEMLIEWGQKYGHHEAALARLIELHREANG